MLILGKIYAFHVIYINIFVCSSINQNKVHLMTNLMKANTVCFVFMETESKKLIFMNQ